MKMNRKSNTNNFIITFCVTVKRQEYNILEINETLEHSIEIRQAKSLGIFKSQLKTHFLRLAFN